MIGRGPKYRRVRHPGHEWLQTRWREWFGYQRHFATAGKVRSFRVDTDVPRRTGWPCSSGRLYSNRCGVSAGGEESKYAVEVVEQGFFVAGLNGVAE